MSVRALIKKTVEFNHICLSLRKTILQ